MRKLFIYFVVAIVAVTVIVVIGYSSLWGQISIGILASTLPLIIDSVNNLKFSRLKEGIYIYFLFHNKLVRLSIAYLIRIKIGNQYLLVRGERLAHQYQPVGGAYKFYQTALTFLQSIESQDDNMVDVDDASKNDLRIRIKGKYYFKFWKWFYSGKDRELSPHREFYEELIKSGIIDSDNFHYLEYNIIGENRLFHKYSDYARGPEVILCIIHDLLPNEQQKSDFSSIINKTSDLYYWATEDEIVHKGVIPQKKYNHLFSETSKLIL